MVIMMMTMFMLSMTWMARVLWWVTHCDTVSSEDIEETKKCRVDGSHSDCHRPISDDDDCDTDDGDYDDDYANDMQKFYPGNLDWFGELRNLGTSHEVGLLCGNMKKHVENLETRRKCRTR